MKKLNILVESTANAVANKTIYGVEIADPSGNLSGRAPVTAMIQTYVPAVIDGVQTSILSTKEMTLSYVAVELSSANPLYAKVDQFINNYDQFTLSSGIIASKAGYNSTINRHIEALDGRYPYVCNNMQINVGGMATNNGGVLAGLIQGDDI